MAKEKKEKGSLRKEFAAFIARGNVLDMAVGVIIGGAFNAIVTAVVNILLSVATWWVPGGLKGLVTVLPAANNLQRGLNEGIGLGQKFAAGDLQALATELAKANYADAIANNPNYLLENPTVIESAKTLITSKYTLHGALYTYNLSAVIDWGTFINAVISFIIIALTMFVIVKVANKMNAYRTELKAKAEEKLKKNNPADETQAEETAEEAQAE